MITEALLIRNTSEVMRYSPFTHSRQHQAPFRSPSPTIPSKGGRQ